MSGKSSGESFVAFATCSAMGTAPCIVSPNTAKERFKRRRRKWLPLQQDTRRGCTEITVKANEALLRCAAGRKLRSVRLTNEAAYRTTFAGKSESSLTTTVLPFVRLDFLYATISIVSQRRTRSTQISSSLPAATSFAAKRPVVQRGAGKSTPTEELDALLKDGYGPMLHIFQLESASVCSRLSCAKRGMRRPTTRLNGGSVPDGNSSTAVTSGALSSRTIYDPSVPPGHGASGRPWLCSGASVGCSTLSRATELVSNNSRSGSDISNTDGRQVMQSTSLH